MEEQQSGVKELLTSTVGIIIPTHDPEAFLTKLLPSVEYILELNEITTWLINFNGDRWTPSNMYDVLCILEDYGFKAEFTCTGTWDKPIKVLKMREQCAEMAPDCDLFLFVDDDFRFVKGTSKYPFTSGQRYLHSIDYMTRFPKCGIVNTKSFLGGTHQKLKIVPVKDDMVATNRGLLLRNMKDHGFLLALREMRDMKGGLEEQSIAYLRNEYGLFTAKQMNNPTVHITGKLSNWDNQPTDFHNIGVINRNLAGWIRDRYQPEWDYQHRKLPSKLWELYLKAGGIELTDDLIVDYAEYEGWDTNSVGKPRKE